MSDDKQPERGEIEGKEPPKGFVSSGVGNENNEVINKQTPDQFYGTGPRPDEAEAPRSHATKGMTQLGWTEASRLENTADAQERDRKLAEKRAAKED